MKHTPGPWRVISHERKSKPDKFGRVAETRDVFINGADGLGSIAKLYVGHDVDARLIAAAPDLLAALEALSPILYNDGPLVKAYADITPLVEAAIAKAKG